MEWHIALIIFGLLLSAAGIVFGAVFLGYSAVRAFKSATAPFRVGVSRLVVLSCAVFLAVGGMRISCLSHQRLTDDPSSTGFSSAALALGQGVLHTLQTFSLDEEYENSVGQMENLVLDLSDGKVANPQKEDYGRAATVAASVTTMLTVLFNCAAPIAGGAVIFEILAALFPKLRLLLLMTSFFKKKVYFSELNDRSLALMKSILAENSSYFKRPVIVFTDAYSSDMDEHSSELLEEARVYGAVCVKDDLANIPKSPFGQRIYFLIDEDEEGNLKAMAEFCTDKNLRAIRGAHVYVFTGNDDTYLQVERRAREALLRTRLFKKGEKLPVFIPVQSYRNLVINLFNEIPLYEPLVCKKQKKGDLPLTLTVFGCGEIGMETVLAAYWYGQMGGVKLKINVVSREDEDSFYRRLDRLNPEIRKSMKEKSRILRYGRGEGEYCPAYCTLKYLPFDLEKGEFGLGEGGKARDILSSKLLQETDYFVVALGSDEDNVALAEKLRRYLSVVRLKNDLKNEKNEAKNKRDARNQTYPLYEILVIDDGSKEEYHSILASKVTGEKERLITIANSGAAEARNTGIRESKGDFICFLDIDDWLTDDFLERAVEYQLQSGADIVIGGVTHRDYYDQAEHLFKCKQLDFLLFDTETMASFIPHLLGPEYLLHFEGGDITRGPVARLVKKELATVVPFDKNIIIGEDLIWNIKLLIK